MIRDLDILKILLQRDNCTNFIKILDTSKLCKETEILIHDFEAYYEKFNDDESIDFEKFSTFFHHLRHPELSREDRDRYDKLLNNLQTPLSDSADLLIERYKSQALGQELVDLIANEPNPDKYLAAIDRVLLKEVSTKIEFIDTDIRNALKSTDISTGYRWRLKELNTMVGTVMPKTFGVIGARPDSGKTSFLVSELSYVCQQLSPTESILWLNNEGSGNELIPRLYSAMLGKRRDEISEQTGKARKEFIELGGDKIRIVDIHGQNVRYIEKLIKQTKPRVVVIDMLDHVAGFTNKQNDTVDAKYGRLYQWARELSNIYNCTVIGTSQISIVTAKNGTELYLPFPDMGRLVGSKTLKAGAASWILMIGQLEPSGTKRFLSVPKAKRGDKELKCEVFFDLERSLFLNHNTPFGYAND